MTNLNRAFTLVEVLTVSVLVTVIASVVVFSYSSIQKTSRDEQRKTSASILAESLEKYFDKNSEYPSVASLADKNVTTVQLKLNLSDPNVLRLPGNSSSTASISTNTPSATVIQYSGSVASPGDASKCSTNVNGACDAFTLKYVRESDGKVVTIKSRRGTASAQPSGAAPSAPSITLTPSSSNVYVQWNVSSGTTPIVYSVSYRRLADSTFTNIGSCQSISVTSCSALGLSPSTTYVFKVVASNSIGSSSAEATTTTTAVSTPPQGNPPSSPTVSVSTTSSTAGLQWSVTSGDSPITYSVSYKLSSSSTYTSVSSCQSISVMYCDISGLQAGTTYDFLVIAVNSAGSSTGTATATTLTAASPQPPSTPQSPTTPAIPSLSSTSNATNTTWTWSSVTCNVGSAEYEYTYAPRGSASQAATTTTLSYSPTTNSQGMIYDLSVRARCKSGSLTSAWSGSASDSYTRPITTRIQATAGGNQMYIPQPTLNTIWAAAIVNDLSQACPVGTSPFIRTYVAINRVGQPGGYNIMQDWEPHSRSAWYTYTGGFGQGDGAEFLFYTRCQNDITGVAGDYYSADIYGNLTVEIARNKPTRGAYSRSCAGAASSLGTSATAYCTADSSIAFPPF